MRLMSELHRVWQRMEECLDAIYPEYSPNMRCSSLLTREFTVRTFKYMHLSRETQSPSRRVVWAGVFTSRA